MKALRLSRETLWLLGILVLAFLLRLFAVNFGLPHLYHADEPIVVNHALAFGTGDLNPHFFKIPPLISYLLFLCYGVTFALGRVLGIFHSPADFEQLFFSDPTSFYLIARMVFGVFLGTTAVYMIYRLVKRFWNAERALMAALFLAVNFLHARDSHYIYTDIPLLCVLLAGFYSILRMREAPLSWKRHLLCGFMIGLATATKYNGVFLAIPYLWICFRTVTWKKFLEFCVLAAVAAAAVFGALNPYAILDRAFFLKEILGQSTANSGGMSLLHHLKYSLSGAMGLSLLTIALAGWLRAVFSRKPALEAVAVFVLGYYLVLCKWGQPYDRYVLPLVPFLCILAAEFLISRKDELSQGKRLLDPVLWFLVFSVVVLPSVVRIVQWDRLMIAPDVRTVAKSWIEAHVPSGSRIAMEGTSFMPRLSFTANELKEKLASLEQMGAQNGAKKRRIEALLSMPTQPSYELFFMSDRPGISNFLFGEPQIPFDLEVLRQKHVEYVLTVDGSQGTGDTFNEELKKNADPVMRFSPYREPGQTRSFDFQPLTGGPFLWKDIRSRERNGYPLTLYKLK